MFEHTEKELYKRKNASNEIYKIKYLTVLLVQDNIGIEPINCH